MGSEYWALDVALMFLSPECWGAVISQSLKIEIRTQQIANPK
jgi:hypothetical protein